LSTLSVSFVCSFNRARSLMAAAIFGEQLRRRGLDSVVRVSSCGVAVLPDSGADERALRVLAEHGYPVPAAHCARQVDGDDLGADLVVAMGSEHVGRLQQRGVDAAKIRCLDVANPC
jgi:protein-tyrosine-phosphatase